MATRSNFSFGKLNSNKYEIDLVDVIGLILGPAAASFIFMVFSFEVMVFGGYDLTAALWTIAGADISVALLVASGSGIWILITNVANSETEHEGYELGVIVVAILLPIGMVFVPAIEALIMWHGLTQVFAWIYVSGAYVYVSYVG